jgi:hypothetical protein
MTRGSYPKAMQRIGNSEFMADSSSKGSKHFLRLDTKAHLQMLIPKSISPESEAGLEQYSISMCFRFPKKIPPQGAAVLGVGSLAVRATPTGILHLQGLSGSSDIPSRRSIVHNEWSIVTLTADCVSKHVVLWVDGNIVHEQSDLHGLCELRDTTARVLGCHVALCSKAISGIQSVCADLRMVEIDTCVLSLGEILAIHVPLGVWSCSCGARSGPAFSTCRSCSAEKRKSAPRPAGDAHPDKPGLTIVVNQSFKEIVLNKDKHVFLDLTADWCGPSVDMQPEWANLAYLLKDYDDIVIAQMDADANEVDRFYLPEEHVPVLKLFPKTDKSNYVSFPDGQPRTCLEFVQFLEQYTQLDISKFKADRLPAYFKEKDVPAIVSKAQSALACAIKNGRMRVDAGTMPGQQTSDLFMTEAANGHADSQQKNAVLARRFLAQYFLDVEAFPSDSESLAFIENGTWNESHAPLEQVQHLMAHVKQHVESCLSLTMPENPQAYLPHALMQMPVLLGPLSVLTTKHDLKALQESTKMRADKHLTSREVSEMFNKAKQALRNADVAALEKLLMQGLPAVSHQGESLVCVAAGEGHVQLLELLFVHGGDLAELVTTAQHESLSSLDIASCMGHESVCEYLLRNGACLGSALLKAVEGGHLNIVCRLLAAGANPDLRIQGRSAVHAAVLAQRDDILGVLLSHDSQLQKPLGKQLCKQLGIATGSNVLHAAARLSLVRSIEQVLKRWPEGAETFNDAQQTPFDLADISVKPFIRPRFLHTLRLLRSCVIGGQKGRTSAYQQLKDMFDRGDADANAQDVRGWTALMAAAIANDADSCRLLCHHGARWQEQGRNGLTALFWANAAGADEARRVLEDLGAKLAPKERAGLQKLR